MAKQAGKRKNGAKADATVGLPPLNLHAAGIDVGSAEHYVAVPPDRDAEPVRKFGSFTADLHRMARWLKDCRIKTVVMQSTGVYWMALYDVLESHRIGSERGERTPHQNIAGAQDGCAGMPMVAEAAHLWPAE